MLGSFTPAMGYLNASAGNMPAMKQRAAYVGQLSCRCVAVSGAAVSHQGHDLAGYGCPSNLICHQSVKASGRRRSLLVKRPTPMAAKGYLVEDCWPSLLVRSPRDGGGARSSCVLRWCNLGLIAMVASVAER